MADDINLRSRAIKASFWALLATYTTQAIRIVAMLFVAALLSPDDFGLYSMATVAAGFFSIFSSFGLHSALIWNREDPETAAGTAFCMTIFGAIVTSFLIFSFSTPLSVFFNEPRLALVLKIIAFEPLVSMFTTIHFIMLSRELYFRSRYLFGLSSSLAGNFVLILSAYLGMGIWSFVFSSYTSIVVGSAYLLFFSGIKFPIRFDKKMAYKLLRFGLVAAVNGYLFFLLFNLDYAIVGKILNTVQLGYYSFAYRFANVPANYISQAIVGVAFPVFAMVKHDADKMLRGYVKGTHWLTLAVMPAAVVLILFGPSVMDLLYGAKWMPAYNAFRILCLYGLSEAIIAPVGSLLYAAGKPSYQMWINVFRVITVVPAAVWAGSRWGFEGVAVAFTAIFLIAGVISVWTVKKYFDTTWMNLIKPVFMTAVACLAGGAASLTARAFIPFSGWPSVISSVSLFLAAALLTQYGIDRELRSIVRSGAEILNYKNITNNLFKKAYRING
ncbi:MAG: lipopolysaccharide biosynthesis protein [Nitrospiraceae bacterium]|nr:MAG: lipopolysaccharide biosynthesis protein [Nitrospiraceae bacterium]